MSDEPIEKIALEAISNLKDKIVYAIWQGTACHNDSYEASKAHTRALALTRTKLDEALMWCGKAEEELPGSVEADGEKHE